MKKKTKFALFAAASAGLALAGAKLWQMIRCQNDELNEMIRQEPGHSVPPMEEPDPEDYVIPVHPAAGAVQPSEGLDEDDFVRPEDEDEEEDEEEDAQSEEEEEDNEPL